MGWTVQRAAAMPGARPVTPCDGARVHTRRRPMRRYDFPSPWWDEVSKDAKDLIGKMLHLDVDKRYTAEKVGSP